MLGRIETDCAVQPTGRAASPELPQVVVGLHPSLPAPPPPDPMRQVIVSEIQVGCWMAVQFGLDRRTMYALGQDPNLVVPRQLPSRAPAHPEFRTLGRGASKGREENL